MTGEIDEFGLPVVRLTIGGREWVATIDTGFNGDLEMPHELAPFFSPKRSGDARTTLAAGQVIDEDLYTISFPFDGEIVQADVVFATTDGILIGTNLLQRHRLEINFVAGTVALEKVAAG